MSLDKVAYIKVFPGIGTARVGNSPEYFIGPEFPGDIPNLDKNYKDANGFLKPQAARFRVYGYDENDNVVAEITHDPDNGTTLEWDVHMRNLKAANYAFQGKFGFNPDQYRNPGVTPNTPGTDPNDRTRLIIDPGAKTISGINRKLNSKNGPVYLDGGVIFQGGFKAEIPTSLLHQGMSGYTEVTYKEKEVSLGRLETDADGRLIVVGGKGEAGCLIEPPIILQKGVSYFKKTNVQLSQSIANSPASKKAPYTFHCHEIPNLKIENLDQVSLVLAGNEKGRGHVAAYDEVVISVNGNQVYCHDFRNADKVVKSSIPLDVTSVLEPFKGQEVDFKIEFNNLGGSQIGASEFWLVYINENPTSNGNSYFNNPGWYDDTAGGSINANVTINGVPFSTDNKNSQRGWVAVSPPKYTPTMNNVVSLLDLQLAMYPESDPVSGTLNFATVSNNGVPRFSSGSALDFQSLSQLTDGIGGASIARLNKKDYLAYTGEDGCNLLAVSTDNGTTWSQVEMLINPLESGSLFSTKTKFSPSLCVYNGLLHYIVVNEEGLIGILTSTDGVTFNTETPTVAPASKDLPYSKIITASSAPSAIPYNGMLYISYTDDNGNIIIAHKYLIPSTKDYFYAFNSTNQSLLNGTRPKLAVFFGNLYCAYTGNDTNAYIGSYNNYSPAPSEPVEVSFEFNRVDSAPTSNLSPSIGSSHGKLYYSIIDKYSNLQLAASAPGLFDLDFISLGKFEANDNLDIANFSDIEFYRDVYPTLKTVTDYAWVNEKAYQGHAPGKVGDFLTDRSLPIFSNPLSKMSNFFRLAVFRFLRKPEQLTPMVPPPPFSFDAKEIPDGGIQTGTLMPHLFGEGGSPLENGFNGTNFPNQWLSLTPQQLWKFQEWVNGNYSGGTPPTSDVPTKGKTLNDVCKNVADQPAALNFSALEPTVGGGFHPGIELTYYMKEPAFFEEAFRFSDKIRHNGLSAPITPGSVAAYMSIPWQGDFWSCNISWWAAMRPDIVIPKEVPPPFIPWYRGEKIGIPADADNLTDYEGGYEHMVRYWSDFGFVVPSGQTDQGMFVMHESERNKALDNANLPIRAFNQPENALIGKSFPSKNSAGNPAVFNTEKTDLLIPATGKIILAGNSEGTGQIYVDDEVTISMKYCTWTDKIEDGIKTSVYSDPIKKVIKTIDFSNGNSGKITPLDPIDITDEIRSQPGYKPGTIVTIYVEYQDTNGGSSGASEFWLVYPEQPVLLGSSQPTAQPKSNLPAPFYTNTIPVSIPSSGKVILSGSLDGTADFKVDNECVILIEGKQVYSNNFGSTTKIPPTASAPVDITSNLTAYQGRTVFMEIQYINFNAVSEATEIWLTFES